VLVALACGDAAAWGGGVGGGAGVIAVAKGTPSGYHGDWFGKGKGKGKSRKGEGNGNGKAKGKSRGVPNLQIMESELARAERDAGNLQHIIMEEKELLVTLPVDEQGALEQKIDLNEERLLIKMESVDRLQAVAAALKESGTVDTLRTVGDDTSLFTQTAATGIADEHEDRQGQASNEIMIGWKGKTFRFCPMRFFGFMSIGVVLLSIMCYNIGSARRMIRRRITEASEALQHPTADGQKARPEDQKGSGAQV